MDDEGGIDPLDALRQANPARPELLPPASLARVRASVQEMVMTDADRRRTRAPMRSRLALGGVAAGALSIIAVLVGLQAFGPATPGIGSASPTSGVAAATTSALSPTTAPTTAAPTTTAPTTGPSEPPSGPPTPTGPASPTPTAPPIGGMASCVEPYSLAALRHRTFAFSGTVLSMAGEEVTFQVDTWYRGGAGERITLIATGMTGTTITSAGGPSLMAGRRYLVAGDDHFAWPCGYTQPYDPTVASSWAAALHP